MAGRRRRRCAAAALDLRFKEPGVEAAFVASRAQAGWRFISAACVVAIVFQLYNQGPWVAQVGPPASLDDFRLPRFAVVSFNLVVQLVGLSLLMLTRLRFGRFPRVGYELVTSVVLCLDTVVTVVGRSWNAVVLERGQLGSFEATVGDASEEARMLLTLDLIITAMCLASPSRVPYLLFNMTFLFLGYAVSIFVFGTPLEAPLGSVFALVTLAGFALTGAWQNELGARKKWQQQQALQEQENALQGASSMARGMRAIAERLCDLVFKLDGELRVLDGEKAHESFFGRPLQGEHFANYLAPGDQDRFREMLTQTSMMMIPHCIPATLLRQGHAVEANILAVDTGSQTQRYIIGVRMDVPLAAAAADEGEESVPVYDIEQWRTQRAEAEEDVLSYAAAASALESVTSALPFRSVRLDALEELGRREHWWIDPEDLQMTKPTRVLGWGGYGQVIMAVMQGRAVAVKTVMSGAKASRLGALANELRVFRHVRHPNLVQFYGAVLDASQSQLALVFELVCGVELEEFVTRAPAPLVASDQFCVIRDVCCALWYLHCQRPPIMHGDVKPSNVMVERAEARLHAKLIDFGLSSVIASGESRRGGTKAWAAPESSRSSYKPRPSADVFSFGLLAHFVLTGLHPCARSAHGDAARATQAASEEGSVELPAAPEGTDPFQPASRELCQACLQMEEWRRPTMQSVHQELAGWLSQAMVADLGLEAATAQLPGLGWDAGAPWLRMAPGSQAEAEDVPLPIQIDLSPDLDISFIGKGAASVLGPVCVGQSFHELLFEPGCFQLLADALRGDVRRRSTFAPRVIHLSGVALKSPRSAAAARDASVKVFVPDSSGRISVLILALHERSEGDPAEGGTTNIVGPCTPDARGGPVMSL